MCEYEFHHEFLVTYDPPVTGHTKVLGLLL